MLAKGATVVLSSQTPNNLWETGTFAANAAPRFVGYQKTASSALGGAAAGVAFVDHFQAQANAYARLGAEAVGAFYPNDHTHTTPDGAELAAQAFVQAVAEGMNGTSSLQALIAAGFPAVY
jgi:rhamnogalacturonan acetylesterase